MKYKDFKAFEKVYSVPFVQNKFKETIELLDQACEVLAKEVYQENLVTIMVDKAMVYIANNQPEKCMDSLECLIDKGFPSPLQMRRFKSLEGNDRFLKLKERNNQLLIEAQKKSQFQYKVYLPKNYSEEKQYPLFINLHGDGLGGNIQDQAWYWKPDSLLNQGYIVVYPQSSQLYCHNNYRWLKEPILARKEIKACYEEVTKQYAVDKSRIVLSGFSGGAITTVDIIMTDTIPTRGFICLCPEIKPESFTKENVIKAKERGIKGIFMEGENMMPMPEEEAMLRVFEEAGLPHDYYTNKGIGHWYPEDLDDKVNQALKFIFV